MGNIIPNGLYCAYLRKSRADVEAEALGRGETLARHENELRRFAERSGIHIAQWYREIVSGDTISERPEVRRMLSDIEDGQWDGVLVVDVDRLGRGDSIDQGTILQTFALTNTLLVTPDKVYDPADDNDADFFEIKLFFSRREYNTIKKRMQRGRLSSALDGCYQGGRCPYGYEKYKLPNRKGYSLRIVPEKAAVVRSIFEWYAYGMDGKEVGAGVIAQRLHDMGLTTDLGNEFEPSYVRYMLRNSIYIGRITWNKRVQKKQIRNGVRNRVREKNDNPIDVPGHHEPIIPMELWNIVQNIMDTHEKRPKPKNTVTTNPLSGLVICSECGKHMQQKPDPTRKAPFMFCPTQRCPTYAAYTYIVEDAILAVLEQWVNRFEAQSNDRCTGNPTAIHSAMQSALEQLRTQESTIQKQYAKLYDLLEQGVYTVDVFRDRRAELDARLLDTRQRISMLEQKNRPDPIAALIPQIKTVLAAYRKAPTAADKNALLRTVVSRIEYRKTQRCYRNNQPGDYLSVEVFPRIPNSSTDKG